MARVLLVDDDDDLREALATALDLAGLETVAVADGTRALELLQDESIEVVVSDIRMPGIDGRQLLQRIVGADPDLAVILITGHGDIEQAVGALRQGAYDFLAKPFATDRLIESVLRGIDRRQLVLENRRLRNQAEQAGGGAHLPLVGTSPAARQLSATVHQIGGTSVDVLIEGEWGTGKRALADMLFRAQPSASGGMLQVLDCSALGETEMERAIAGKGARFGRTGSTILLAGIDLLSGPLQLRLLQVLGAQDSLALDAGPAQRVFSTSTARLEDMVRDGAFRSDLYFRIAPVRIAVPPLRERRRDIPLLFTRMVEAAARRFQRPLPVIGDATLGRLVDHDWPGNLRELQNVAEQAVLNLDRIADRLGEAAETSLPQRVARFEAEAIRAALRAEHGRIAPTCARLGVPRKTLYDKLARYEIQPGDFRTTDGQPRRGQR